MTTRRLRQVLTTLGVAAALACAAAAPALADDPGSGSRFRVTATFVAAVLGFDACGLRVEGSGVARGTHIGNGEWRNAECIDPFPPPNAHVVGEGVITAANGDELTVDYDATTPPPDSTGAIHARGTYTIAGGTGRFAGATGNGTLAVDGEAGGSETAQFDGRIHLHEED